MSETNNASGDQQEERQPTTGATAAQTAMLQDKVESGLFVTRVLTLAFCILFIVPLLGGSPATWYQRALLASAATSALRLHQRVAGNFRFSREYLTMLLAEDSCHYLIFSILFVSTSPVTIALIPLCLFALIQCTKFARALLSCRPNGGPAFIQSLVGKVEQNQRFLFRFIAINEILLMGVVVLLIFTGGASIFLPFIYFRFLTLRYASLRNPYTRTTIYELRVTLQQLSYNSSCPAIVANAINKSIALVSRFAPLNSPTNMAPPSR